MDIFPIYPMDIFLVAEISVSQLMDTEQTNTSYREGSVGTFLPRYNLGLNSEWATLPCQCERGSLQGFAFSVTPAATHRAAACPSPLTVFPKSSAFCKLLGSNSK